MIPSANEIDKILPQTQCRKCTYPDCMSYAKAIVKGEKHNKCITGGQETVKKLSKIIHKKEIQLDTSLGKEQSRIKVKINEDMCIGCVKCIEACPVDAISGTRKMMHTVIEHECSGCELCIDPCPMDCISVVDIIENKDQIESEKQHSEKMKNHYRKRYYSHKERIERIKNEKIKHYMIMSSDKSIDKKLYIAKSISKFKSKRKNLKNECREKSKNI